MLRRRSRRSLCDINNMKNRDDLLVCFPSRAHLSLMPKPICSPARASEPVSRHHHQRRHHNNMFAENRRSYDSDMSEPTSPKVTCAGQIKVRPKNKGSCKNWQSVMEEIERIHDKNKQKKKRSSAWIDALGFKKDVMQFLTCLRNVRFDFHCFGSFPTTDEISSDDDDDEYDDDECKDDEENMRVTEESEEINDDESSSSKAVFSKWFMILRENGGNKEFIKEEESKRETIRPCLVDDDSSVPPPNALFLMRCRSAPAKSWMEEKEEEEEEEKEKQRLVVMRCGADFSKLSNDIAKETWVGGDMLSRSLKR